MKKIRNQKIIFISLILAICIISCIAYTFPNLLSMCFFLSNAAAAFLFSAFSWICPSLNHSSRTQKMSPIKWVTGIAILITYMGVIWYFLWNYPLSSITEPIHCFIVIWGISIFTFLTLTLFGFFTIQKRDGKFQ